MNICFGEVLKIRSCVFGEVIEECIMMCGFVIDLILFSEVN